MDEEREELAGDEPGMSGLLDDDVNDVLEPKIAGLPEKGLAPVVETLRPEDRLSECEHVWGKIVARYRPARESAGSLANVGLAVVTNSKGEKLHELAGVVFIRRLLLAPVQVQVDHHGRVHRY